MSYTTWSTQGYGFCVDDIIMKNEISKEQIETLLDKAPVFKNTVYEWLKECEIFEPTLDDYLEFDSEYSSGLACLLKNVINEVEEIQVIIVDDFNTDWYILFEPSYPWQENSEKVKALTEDSLREIYRKYISIFTDELIEITYQDVENGG